MTRTLARTAFSVSESRGTRNNHGMTRYSHGVNPGHRMPWALPRTACEGKRGRERERGRGRKRERGGGGKRKR